MAEYAGDSLKHFRPKSFFFRTKAQVEFGFELTKPSTGQDYSINPLTGAEKIKQLRDTWCSATAS